MEEYTIKCTKEQIQKAYKLGAPIELNVPTADQMRTWLYEKHCIRLHIWINDYAPCDSESTQWLWGYEYLDGGSDIVRYDREHGVDYRSAILYAIDMALDYLDNKINNIAE